MKRRWLSFLVALAVVVTPAGAEPLPVRRFVAVDPAPAAPSQEELARWDLRLRRWLEDRRLATTGDAVPIAPSDARPWRELLDGDGRPWEALGVPAARERAVREAWAAFRRGRGAFADGILAAAARRGPAIAFPLPWDWSDGEAFLPEADRFSAQLEGKVAVRCHWANDGGTESGASRWIDGAPVTGTTPLGEGLHATVSYRNGRWRQGSVRCGDGVLRMGAESDVPAALVASDEAPIVVSFWRANGVVVGWFGSQKIERLTGPAELERSVALDGGGGPLAALTLPSALLVPRTGGVDAAPRSVAPPRETAETASASKIPRWLWVALGAAAVGGGALWWAQRENAGRSGGVSVKWD